MARGAGSGEDRAERLPPLNALRVFHAVMRQGSLRAAAEVLRVSPQAVSQQVQILEDALGVPLFDRRGRGANPTEAAILLMHHVQAAFDELTEGVRRVTRKPSRARVNVNASPFFATRYLLDRLAGFRAIEPEADLRLTTMVELPDFAADEVDVAIQWGYGHWPGLEVHLLLTDRKDLCCTPELAERLKTPQDLCDLPLVHPVMSPELWPNVLAHLGVTKRGQSNDLRLQDAATMRRAALAGLGVGLLSTIDADEDLELGRLVAPFGRDVMAGMEPSKVPGFYMVFPRAHRRVRAIATFCDWVQAQDWTEGA
ncbi:LysR substrate-binding domain-containing protein [Thioclava sp. FR2]|uniref:LysR substrate-binding domain-containing protein n=1 Tax=Thioclava sp. FR2 TaxID=3445780 RepID=UPI003EBC444B